MNNIHKFDLTMKIREPLEGEDERDIDSFNDVLKRLEDTLTYTGNMIDSMESVITMDQESMKLESKHIIGFLKKLEKSVKHKFPYIDIDTKFDPIEDYQIEFIIKNAKLE